MAQTHIPGKDAALEDSISHLQAQLVELGFNIEEKSWLQPVSNVWSVHIRDKHCPLLFTNGKGASKKAALASALGEFFERLATHYFWADYYLGDEIANQPFVQYSNERWFPLTDEQQWPSGILNNELRQFYNPDNALTLRDIVDRNSASTERGICCLPYQCQRTQQTVYFPVNIIGNLYVSNGMSAGNTPGEARVQALSEIFERYVKFKIISEGIALPQIPSSILQRYPGIQAGIRDLEAAGFSLLAQDASLGGKYPVMAVTLLNPYNQGLYASFGAHPRFEVALERALTELLQGRDLDALDHFPEPGFDLDEIASDENLETHFIDSSGIVSWRFLHQTPDYEFVDWDRYTGDSAANISTEDEFEWCCERIHAEGCDIYIADYPQLGVYACRILVPGMSEIYPIDELQWANNNAGIELRELILQPRKAPDECKQLISALEALNLDDQYPVATLLGLPADSKSLWKDLRLIEYITLLALKVGDKERIMEGVQWLIHFQQINPSRLRVYRCINALIQFDNTEPYTQALESLYGTDVLTQAQRLLNREDIFPMDSQWDMHQRLIASYQKLPR